MTIRCTYGWPWNKLGVWPPCNERGWWRRRKKNDTKGAPPAFDECRGLEFWDHKTLEAIARIVAHDTDGQ